MLLKLGYEKTIDGYAHPTRKVLFVGDYIDRGLKIRETLEIVKSMVDTGNAIALMGNHEYNALCFHMKKPDGGHLRPHSIKNIIQHYDTLKQFQNRQDEYDNYIKWFKTLKGKEITLPNELSFQDKDGNYRTEMRIKWWENPAEMTYKSISIKAIDALPEQPIHKTQVTSLSCYQPDDKSLFFGHYWLKGNPSLYKKNICCLDYSVAEKGKLAAYRYSGERALMSDNFVYVYDLSLT